MKMMLSEENHKLLNVRSPAPNGDEGKYRQSYRDGAALDPEDKTLQSGSAAYSYQTLLPTSTKRSRSRISVRDTLLALVNLCATAFGTGLLSLPYSMKLGGLVVGVVALTGLCAVSTYTTAILSKACQLSRESTYDGCLGYYFGSGARLIGKVTIMLCLFVLAMTYLVALVDLMDSAVSRFLDAEREKYRPIQLAALVVVTFPLTLVKRLSALGFVSWVAVLSCFFIAFSLVFYILPLQALNYAYHYIWCETLKEVSISQEREAKELGTYSHLAIYICYVIAGVFGYLTYGRSTEGDIFDNLPPDDEIVTIGRLAAGCILLFSYPILIVPLRDHLLRLSSLDRRSEQWAAVSVSGMISIVLYGCCYFLKDLTLANAVAGTVASFIVYVFPGALLLRISGLERKSLVPGCLIILLGLAVSVSGIIYTLREDDGPL